MLSLVQQKPVSLAFLHAGMYKTRDIASQLQLQGTGCMAALDAERYLEGTATHDWSKSL